MKHLYALLVFAVFAAGIATGGIVGALMPNDTLTAQSYTATSRGLNYQPTTVDEPQNEDILRSKPQQPSANGPLERDSPADWIQESQIEMRPDGVFIKINNPQWAILADTNSMDPVFDIGSHLIQVHPSSQAQIRVGDIISYKAPVGFSIVHRVIEIGEDEGGWYVITKGDNNPTPDPWKIRFDWITRVTVMIIY